MTNYVFDVTHSNPQDQKLIYEFGKEMKFDIEQIRRKNDRYKSLETLLKSPAIMASGISKIFSPEKRKELYDRMKLLLQEKQVGNNCDINDEEIIAVAVKLLECISISTKQHKVLLLKCVN